MQNLVSFFGIFVFITCAWLLSENRRAFPWRIVLWGLALQFTFGFLVLWWEPGAQFFLKLNDVFNALLNFNREGTTFVFGSIGTDVNGVTPMSLKEYLTRVGANSPDPLVQAAIQNGTVPGFIFAFQVLTTIIFFSALLSVLYYYGVMQKIVDLFARIMAHTMKVSGAEALSNSANIFVGQTEAPLVVRPFIEKMTRSELMAVMVGGFANTAGGVLGAYVLMLSGYFPNIAAHLISASVLSAPAAFIMAKVMVPEREKPVTLGSVKMDVASDDANVLDAAANGSTVGWQLAINVTAMLMAFIALVALVNLMVGWAGGLFRDTAGLVRFDLMALALVGVLAWTARKGAPKDTHVWLGLVGVAVVYGVLRTALSPQLAAAAGAVLLTGWGAAFLLMGRKTPVPHWIAPGLIACVLAVNVAFALFGPLATAAPLSIQMLLGWLHWPVAFAMGVPAQDCYQVARLLGEKLVLTEFVAYADLGSYLGAASRGEVAPLDGRSVVIASYALSGFSNFASIAIQIGGISPMAPSRRHEIAKLGLKAMIGGALASYLLASVAGVFYNGTSMLGR